MSATGRPSSPVGRAPILSAATLARWPVDLVLGAVVDSAAESKSMAPSLRRMLIPLALAQFICSFAGSNMNVMITDISHDLDTTVQGVQVCITLFLLVMAALMIPCGKLTDRLGRKRCFLMGLSIYGVGAVLSAASPGWEC